jgi:Asp-tRNA(Asn)/Glu-tRNA(Gln) amidotransferase A subunit family amidase
VTYRRTPLSTPTVSGPLLKAFVALVGTPLLAPVRHQTFRDFGIQRLRKTPVPDRFQPFPPPLPHRGPAPAERTVHELLEAAMNFGEVPGGFQFEEARSYSRAYRDGTADPQKVAERAITAIADSKSPDLALFIAHDPADVRAQAAQSAERWAKGAPLSPLDGIPLPVKDEVDVRGYPTTAGTAFLGRRGPAAHDSEAVARMRALGAVILGKTNMHEVGIGVTGINAHYGACRNPYDPRRITGGSSSGPAACVAYGLGPYGLAADGGGSIRIPAALCGLVGLKATWGRISEHGATPLCWNVGHIGPVAATARDAALFYVATAGRDDREPSTQVQPPVHLDGVELDHLDGVTLGICRAWFEDADPAMVQACQRLVDQLVAQGAKVREIDVPDIELCKAAHLMLIIAEMTGFLSQYYGDFWKLFGLDVKTNLTLAADVTGGDYVHALRFRQFATEQFLAVLSDVDVIVTPTTGIAAPPIPESALPEGESNLIQLESILRFAAPANLTGFPAIAVPAGYDDGGLPLSCQFLGRPWEEALLLRIARGRRAGRPQAAAPPLPPPPHRRITRESP